MFETITTFSPEIPLSFGAIDNLESCKNCLWIMIQRKFLKIEFSSFFEVFNCRFDILTLANSSYFRTLCYVHIFFLMYHGCKYAH